MYYAGIDVGGTKCAVVLGREQEEMLQIISKECFDTAAYAPAEMLTLFRYSLIRQMEKQNITVSEIHGIGISCGGPLSSEDGVILSPPNLPLWDNIKIVDFFENYFQIPTRLQNDANACAVAEWKYGAGKGLKNMIFLTFGTGFGAGLILNAKLYCGKDDMAGEIGHIRAVKNGPVGYGKKGSFESFCSGGGIAKLGKDMVQKELRLGRYPSVLQKCGNADALTAKIIAEAAEEGDSLCREIYQVSGEKLGMALSILIDLLNPDMIAIGSIFVRSYDLIWEACKSVIERECLPTNYKRCKIVRSALGEQVGDIAALAIAKGDYL